MCRIVALVVLSIVALGATAGCVRTHPGRVDSFFVEPVASENLRSLRAVVLLSDRDVPEVLEVGYPEVYRITGIKRVVREVFLTTLGPAFSSLEFAHGAPPPEYDVLLKPRVAVEVVSRLSNKWRVSVAVAAYDRNEELMTEATAVGEHEFALLPDWSPAFRFAFRKACQDVLPEVAASLDRRFDR
jgi:hypothetical protein